MKLVKISDIFDVKYGVKLYLNNMDISNKTDDIPFVSRTSKNNGIVSYVKPITNLQPNKEHTLSIAGSGSVLETFYQPKPYYSGEHLYVLTPYEQLNIKEMLAYATIIRLNKYRYSFGRQANKTLRDILVPSIDHVKKRTKNISIPKKPTNKAFQQKKVSLQDTHWKWFTISELGCKLSANKPLHKCDIIDDKQGTIPYITRTTDNNGLQSFISYEEYFNKSVKGNCITIGGEGKTPFYQPIDFCTGNNITIIRHTQMNKYVGMFLISVLNKEQFRYNYGRAWNTGRIKNTQIKLPVTPQGTPDWQFMEEYIKSLPYSSNL